MTEATIETHAWRVEWAHYVQEGRENIPTTILKEALSGALFGDVEVTPIVDEVDLPKVGDLVVDGEHLLVRIAWGFGEGVAIARALNEDSVHAYVCWWVEKKYSGEEHTGWYYHSGVYGYGTWDGAWDRVAAEFIERVNRVKGDPDAPHGNRP